MSSTFRLTSALATFAFSSLATSLAPCVTLAAPAPASYVDTGAASYTVTPAGDVGEQITITETRYFEIGYPLDYLAKASITKKRFTGAEGLESEVVLEMRGTNKNRFDKVVWTAKAPGSEVVFPGEGLLGIKQFGCCAAPDITRVFNSETGVKVEALISQLFQVDVPNSNLSERFLGLAVDSKAPQTLGNKTYIGTVTYFSKHQILSRVRVYAQLPNDWTASIDDLKLVDTTAGMRPAGKQAPEIRGETATLWPSDGVDNPAQAFKGFAIEGQMHYDNRTAGFRAVIDGDAFSAKLSKASKDVELQVVN